MTAQASRGGVCRLADVPIGAMFRVTDVLRAEVRARCAGAGIVAGDQLFFVACTPNALLQKASGERLMMRWVDACFVEVDLLTTA